MFQQSPLARSIEGDPIGEIVAYGATTLRTEDPQLHEVLVREHVRQSRTLSLVASSSVVAPSVLAAQSSIAVNVTAEGYPGRRYHAGCEVIDGIEALAMERAMRLFGAQYANVQPHSASSANYAVLSSLLRPGDTLLGMELSAGGHLTHGSPPAYSGQYFTAINYGLDSRGYIDYEQVAALARQHRPHVIICGATAYSRHIDFARFRAIADDVGAYLLADISHTAGLVAVGLSPNPVDEAHITTMCTHKQLYGPRGGLILAGRDHASPAPRGEGTLADFLQRTVFPFYQGAPAINAIAAKARALGVASGAQFRATAGRIVEFACALADGLASCGFAVVSGGTENHTVLVDLSGRQISGLVAERALEGCGIVVNKNRVPGDSTPALVGSGIRLGSNTVAARGMGPLEAARCVGLIDQVLGETKAHGWRKYTLSESVKDQVNKQVRMLCDEFPMPGYPLTVF